MSNIQSYKRWELLAQKEEIIIAYAWKESLDSKL